MKKECEIKKYKELCRLLYFQNEKYVFIVLF